MASLRLPFRRSATVESAPPPNKPMADRTVLAKTADSPRAAKKGWMDRLFPVKPGTPVPPWTRVLSLVVVMAVVWEVIWFFTYYFSPGPTDHNLGATWTQVQGFFPIALGLATLGSLPGFWLMRSRITRANAAAAAEEEARKAESRKRAVQTGTPGRARRRRSNQRHDVRR